MQATIVEVTPGLAAEWLATSNIGNRRLYPQHIAKLVDEMRRDEWVENGQSISFDPNGGLLDGQHRLHAIVKSGKSYNLVVVRGVTDSRAFQTYDAVINKRTPAQIAAMRGVERWISYKTTSARALICWEDAESLSDFRSSALWAPSFLPHRVADVAVQISDEWETINSAMHQATRHSGALSHVNAMLIILSRIDPIFTDQFMDRTASGNYEGPNDPCRHFRERLLAPGPWDSDRFKRMAFMAMTTKAWNASKRQEPMKLLRFQRDEAFPRPIGCRKPA
jgi:hypothetical protein